MSLTSDAFNSKLAVISEKMSHHESRTSKVEKGSKCEKGPFETEHVTMTTEFEERKCHILLGCTGSVAAVKVLELINLLKDVEIMGMKSELKVVLTKCSTHFLSLEEIEKLSTVYMDADEWSSWHQMSDPVLHIELRKWADVLVIAPLSANTLAKMANGLSDNLLTCIVRAWDRSKPLLYCPAMNTHMWEHPLTSMHLTLLADFGYLEVPCVCKKLACGEIGFGGMASVETIVAHVTKALLDYIPNKS